MPKKPDTPLTLVVRRGALRRFDKLKKDTAHLPVVVTWDRRTRRQEAVDGSEVPPAEDRRKPLPFTWDLADFVVVTPEGSAAPVEAVAPVAEVEPTVSESRPDDVMEEQEPRRHTSPRRR